MALSTHGITINEDGTTSATTDQLRGVLRYQIRLLELGPRCQWCRSDYYREGRCMRCGDHEAFELRHMDPLRMQLWLKEEILGLFDHATSQSSDLDVLGRQLNIEQRRTGPTDAHAVVTWPSPWPITGR